MPLSKEELDGLGALPGLLRMTAMTEKIQNNSPLAALLYHAADAVSNLLASAGEAAAEIERLREIERDTKWFTNLSELQQQEFKLRTKG